MITFKAVYKTVVEDVRDNESTWALMGTRTLCNFRLRRWETLIQKCLNGQECW